jgi:hypothetical protein
MDRTLKQLPICTESSTEIVDPIRSSPYTDKAEPKRIIDLIETELPTLMKSRVEKALPKNETP